MTEQDIIDFVEQWFQDSIQGTPVGHQTVIYNIVHAAKEELAQRLIKVFVKSPKQPKSDVKE